MEEFSNPKVKIITFAFVLGNKDDKKVNNLFYLTAVEVACTTPPSGILPFHTVISFIFRRCDNGGDMLAINASNHITSSPISLQSVHILRGG